MLPIIKSVLKFGIFVCLYIALYSPLCFGSYILNELIVRVKNVRIDIYCYKQKNCKKTLQYNFFTVS